MPSIYDMDKSTSKGNTVTDYTVKPTITQKSEVGCSTPMKQRTCPQLPKTKK